MKTETMERRGALVAMSGGVDSSVAALLALRSGLDAAGAIMRLHSASDASAEADARAVADRLGIPFYAFDLTEAFDRCVIRPFAADYRAGRTPNPCIYCNKTMKFGAFMHEAAALGKDYVVTGHYARVEQDTSDGRYLLKKAIDTLKDQSYVLYSLSQEQLARIQFPLGGMTKTETRETAKAEGFASVHRDESQDICFIPDGDHPAFIERCTGVIDAPGRFIDTHGNDLGAHRGITRYTVGQRRGLGLAMERPVYVLDILPDSNAVVVGEHDALYKKTLTARGINLIAAERLDKPIRAAVKIRYRHAEQLATVTQMDEDTLRVEFDEPQRAITKGQAAVIYDGDTVVGGGTIY